MKNHRCWARTLNDCAEKISGEHRISVAAWPSKNIAANREERLRSAVEFRLDPAVGSKRKAICAKVNLATLVVKNLCTRHNSALSELDEEAGRFTQAIREFHQTAAGRYPGRAWTKLHWRVNRKLLERWFLKTAIVNAEGCGLPIGGTDAEADEPIQHLTNTVFGLEPTVGSVGLWGLASVGQKISTLPELAINYNESVTPMAQRYVSSCFVEFMQHRYFVCLDPELLVENAASVRGTGIGWDGASILRPVPNLVASETALQISFQE